MKENRHVKALVGFVVVWVLCVGVLTKVHAQEDYYWFSVGFGPASPEYGLGLIGTYQSGWMAGSIRLLHTNEVAILAKPGRFVECAALVSVCTRSETGLLSLGTGLGGVFGSEAECAGTSGSLGLCTYEERPISALGVVLELQAFLTVSQHFALGLYGFANFNAERSVGGLLACLQIGHLKKMSEGNVLNK